MLPRRKTIKVPCQDRTQSKQVKPNIRESGKRILYDDIDSTQD